jgi:hypothetical protein
MSFNGFPDFSIVAPWSDEKVLAKVREMVLPAIAHWADRSLDHRRHGFP